MERAWLPKTPEPLETCAQGELGQRPSTPLLERSDPVAANKQSRSRSAQQRSVLPPPAGAKRPRRRKLPFDPHSTTISLYNIPLYPYTPSTP